MVALARSGSVLSRGVVVGSGSGISQNTTITENAEDVYVLDTGRQG